MADKNSVMKQVDDLEKKLQTSVDKAKKSQMVTIIVGIVIAVVVLGYFSFMSGQVKGLMEPDDLAAMAGDQITTKVKEYRPQVEEAARSKAPDLVDDLVDEVLFRQLPEGRRAREQAIQQESQRQVDEMVTFLLDEFEATMDKHEENIKALGEDLQTQEGTERFQEQIYANLNEALSDQEIAVSIDSYGQALQELRTNIATLSSTERDDMSEVQKATFDLIAVIRELASRSDFSIDNLPTFEGVDDIVQ